MTSQSGSTRSSTEEAWASFESEFGKGWRWDDAGVPNHIALPGSGEPPGAGARVVPPAGIAEVIAEIAAALEGNPTLRGRADRRERRPGAGAPGPHSDEPYGEEPAASPKSVRLFADALRVGDDYVGRAARTPLDLAIYATVAAIPPGETVTYAEVARRVGHPGAARAVGAAMARNPFPSLIPCHRVVGIDGSLRGYAGGLALKRRLLELEEGNATE